MKRALWMICLWAPVTVWAGPSASVREVVMTVQDRMNDRAMESLFGGLDYEYVLAPAPARDVALLEPRVRPAPPDSGRAAAQGSLRATGSVSVAQAEPAGPEGTTVARRDTVRQADGTLQVVEHRVPLPTSATRAGLTVLTRADLPEPLAAVDAASVKQTLGVSSSTSGAG